MGLRAYFLNPISYPPTLGYDERGQGLYRFLNRVRFPHGCSRLVWLGLYRRQPSYDNDDFPTFALTSSSSFNFFREHPLTVSIFLPLLVLKLFFASSGFIRLTFYPESLLAFCNTSLEAAFFVLFLGLMRLSSFCVFSSNIPDAMARLVRSCSYYLLLS